MWLSATCQLSFEISTPTPFVLMLRARSSEQQWIARDSYKIFPAVAVSEITDVYGNLCQRLVAPSGNFNIRTEIITQIVEPPPPTVDLSFVDVQHLPASALIYLLPSRYCESENFSDMANELTYGRSPGFDQVVAIVEWLRRDIRYEPGSSDYPVSASEVNTRQYGVCRDLSHLAIALCRSLSLPSRLVVGYLAELEPMDMHAWFEVFVGSQWVRFDATQQSRRSGYIAIGYGRDAADVAVYNQFGPPVTVLENRVTVSPTSAFLP